MARSYLGFHGETVSGERAVDSPPFGAPQPASCRSADADVPVPRGRSAFQYRGFRTALSDRAQYNVPLHHRVQVDK